MKHSIDFIADGSALQASDKSLEISFEVWIEDFLRDDRSYQLLAIKRGQKSLILLKVITHNHIEVILGDKAHHDVVGFNSLKLN